ncbi:amino acid/polyamine transporter I [Radiomyces spectabilis]|uniref:amino acid/polyamine transporter I n=1 Tax=Radiomyces spectabilis TaxID=64574 RepID=UPI00221F19C3|nr:amino acid/polyamine transporter I [Radiomyces spectabilis]KAI8381369.1 amino acid/polyamine transporter I [Radiomyces spectabilis]
MTISTSNHGMAGYADHTEQLAHMEPLAVGDQRLERKIGWVMGAMMNVSYIIGAGIFVGPALTLQLVGSGGMNIMIWIMGALIASCGTWAFAELGTMLPRSGGELGYLEYCYRKPKYLLAYIFTMWTLMNRSSGVAAQGIVFGGYMNYAIYGASFKSNWLERSWAILLATILTAVNIMSTKVSLKLMAGLTAIKMAVLSLVALIGLLVLVKAIPSDVDAGYNLSFQGTATNIGPYASALYYVMNSYSGWHNLNFIMDEVKDPIRNLPKASAAAISTIALLYVLTNVGYLVVLPLETMKSSEFIVAAEFFTRSLGENFASTVLPVFIALSAFGCAAAINFSAGRVLMESARSGLLPFGRTFGHLNPQIGSPVNAYLLQYTLTILFTVAPPPGAVYQFIVAFAAYPVYVFYTLIALAVLILRKREPFVTRPVVAPLFCVLVFLSFTVYALIFVFIPVENPYYPYWVPYVSAIAAMLLCVVAWYFQIVVKDTPGKSYNETIRARGYMALEQEVFSAYTALPSEESPIMVYDQSLSRSA